MNSVAIRYTVVLAFALGMPSGGTDSGVAEEPKWAEDEKPFIQSLIGAWQGAGTLLGAPATFQMKWEWTLDSQFVHLTFKNRILRADDEDFVLKAQAFYRSTGDKQY